MEDKSNSQSLLHIEKEEECLYQLKKEERQKKEKGGAE